MRKKLWIYLVAAASATAAAAVADNYYDVFVASVENATLFCIM